MHFLLHFFQICLTMSSNFSKKQSLAITQLATVPAHPIPPQQWISTFLSWRDLQIGLITSVSNDSFDVGIPISIMGYCMRSISCFRHASWYLCKSTPIVQSSYLLIKQTIVQILNYVFKVQTSLAMFRS